MRAYLLLGLCGSLAGCLRTTQFQCENDTSCGAGGRCEANNFCSFVDPGCASGRKYSDSAGPNAGKCTDDNMMQVDGGIDSSMMIDAPMGDGGSNCPNDFTALPAAGTHVYKVITAPANWSQQQMACRQMSNNQAYLTVPDNLAELTATDGLTGVGANYWVGINDIGNNNEGMYVNVFPGQAQTFLPWDTANGQPDNQGGQGGQDCVDSLAAAHLLYDDKCTDTLPAVCECNP
jgi:hypothetical protein